MYEGYAPGGVALLIDVLTDNRNRTGAEVRNVFSKLGGSLAEPGAVGWQFSRKGVVHRRRRGRRGRGDDGRPRGRRRRRRRRRRHLAGHVRSVATSTTCATRSRPPGSPSSRPSRRWCRTTWSPIADRRGRQEGPAHRRRARGQRRRPGRVRQLRHQRRDHGSDGVGLMSASASATGRPSSRCRARAGEQYSLADYARQAGGAGVLSGRRHAGVHEAAEHLQRRARRSSTTLDAQVLAISAQDVDSHDKFTGKHGLQVPAAGRHRQAVAGTVRHARPDRLPAPQRVHHRRRRRRSATPTGRSPG